MTSRSPISISNRSISSLLIAREGHRVLDYLYSDLSVERSGGATKRVPPREILKK
ncbi:MAG: hypothetical protein ACFFE8_03385 [Candidatus Heimdallarchaeota archaeon]